jgi:hypothetical protein
MTIWTNDEVGGTVWSGAEEEPGTTIEGPFVVEGDVQLGDATGDALTIWPAVVTWHGSPTTHSGTHSFSGSVTHAQLIVIDSSDSQRVLIGHTASIANLGGFNHAVQVVGSDSVIGSQFLSVSGYGSIAPQIYLTRSKNATKGSHTVLSNGDTLGVLQFTGSDGTDYAGGAQIYAIVSAAAGNDDLPCSLVFATTADATASATEGMRLDHAQCLGVNNTNPSALGRLTVQESGARAAAWVENSVTNQITGTFINTNESAASTVVGAFTNRSANTAYNFLLCQSDANGTPDAEFLLRGDGNSFQDGGTAWGTPADYAEFFESLSGNVIPLGNTVVLVGDKVRRAVATDSPDDIMGVVRPKSGHASIVANAASMKWTNKYLRDDETGEYLLEDYNVYEWEEVIPAANGNPEKRVPRSVASYKIPQGVTIPPNATVKVQQKRKLNPAWDPAIPYIPRAERPEWNVIGLVGQVLIRKGDPVNPRWRKMKDVSATVELWFIR